MEPISQRLLPTLLFFGLTNLNRYQKKFGINLTHGPKLKHRVSQKNNPDEAWLHSLVLQKFCPIWGIPEVNSLERFLPTVLIFALTYFKNTAKISQHEQSFGGLLKMLRTLTYLKNHRKMHHMPIPACHNFAESLTWEKRAQLRWTSLWWELKKIGMQYKIGTTSVKLGKKIRRSASEVKIKGRQKTVLNAIPVAYSIGWLVRIRAFLLDPSSRGEIGRIHTKKNRRTWKSSRNRTN